MQPSANPWLWGTALSGRTGCTVRGVQASAVRQVDVIEFLSNVIVIYCSSGFDSPAPLQVDYFFMDLIS